MFYLYPRDLYPFVSVFSYKKCDKSSQLNLIRKNISDSEFNSKIRLILIYN
jgi:hypothetical protein